MTDTKEEQPLADIKRPPRAATYSAWGFFSAPEGLPGKVIGIGDEVPPVPGRWIIVQNTLYVVVKVLSRSSTGQMKVHVLGWSD